jgi:EAL and modified HD-GYP domain-containing signal transduction protein
MDSLSSAYIARQPIMDREGRLVAYELLFRSGQGNSANVGANDATRATAQMLNTALNSVGLEKLVGTHKAFVNCNRDMLLSDAVLALDPTRFTVEILEDVEVDDDVVRAVRRLREQKFEVALDDFVLTRDGLLSIARLIPHIQIVKMDMMLNGRETWGKASEFFRGKGVRVLAEKVETEADYKECFDQQYSFFQGYYFARPEMLESTKIDTTVLGVMQIIDKIHKGAEVDEIDAAFKPHPGLTLGLLRYMNSAATGLREPVTSVNHAIRLVGRQNLERWLLLLAYAKPGETGAASNPLFENAVQRAYLIEEMGKALELAPALQAKAFLTGIMSHMDALCRAPMKSLVKEFNLDSEIAAALLENQGVLGHMLLVLKNIEEFNGDALENLLAAIHLPKEKFRECQIASFAATAALG